MVKSNSRRYSRPTLYRARSRSRSRHESSHESCSRRISVRTASCSRYSKAGSVTAPRHGRSTKSAQNKAIENGTRKRARSESESDSDSEYYSDSDYKSPIKKNPKCSHARKCNNVNSSRKSSQLTQEGRKWWKEAPREDGVKWKFLEHRGPVFAPDYEPLPKTVQFRYNGKCRKLSLCAEEAAGFYSRFAKHDRTKNPIFNANFFHDWKELMTNSERKAITDFKKCDFRDISDYFQRKAAERKTLSKDQKLEIKEQNEDLVNKFGTCVVDGHKEKIGNFRIEPPGLFLGRGKHPKMGMLKTRVTPEDVTVNCSKNSKVPKPPKGHKWKEILHDNTVSWLACWKENIQGQTKYIWLNNSSRQKGEKDLMKYEQARKLGRNIDRIRRNYRNDFKSKDTRIRQRAVAMYFIDKLALRAGNEKDETQADTVGCCSLRYEHIKLHDKLDGRQYVVAFDFLGKDSIRYVNKFPVDKSVFNLLKGFLRQKRRGDKLFDCLDTGMLNAHLSQLMDGLSAKVFRTYNASHTVQAQLEELTPKRGTEVEKILAYNRANRAVAILCNHKRAAPKSHEKSMQNLDAKIQRKKDDLKETTKELRRLEKGSKEFDRKRAALKRLEDALCKMEFNRTEKEEGKEIALGTSKLNYIDPRITVAWCKKHDVPIEKVYNKTQLSKFRWALDMADKKYKFD